MPDTKQSLELYALALALVPDETEAGDIFMAARDEEHLCHLAAQWRERRGLPYLANPPTLPKLTEEQASYGMHVARRKERRRRSFRLMLVAGMLVVLAAGAAAFGRLPVPGVSLDPTRLDKSGPAQAAQSSAVPLIVEVTRAEATPGAITVWWNYTGAQGDPPVLVLGDSTIGADSVESRREGSGGRIEGSSTYTVITAGRKNARLEIRQRDTNELLTASAPFDLTRVSDPDARVVWGETVIFDHARIPLGTVDQIMLGANYTLLRYRPAGIIAHADTLDVKADGKTLDAYGELAPMRYLTDGQELVFGPVPPGAEEIEVTGRGSGAGAYVSMGLNSTTDVQRYGLDTIVIVDLMVDKDAPFQEATLLTPGEAYRAEVREVERRNNLVRYELRANGIPPGAEVIGVQLYAERQFPGRPVTIDLS
ncbi:MAG: hypothetical protein K0R39_206 [Symbiobacteriaceae bacterium]|jgi:hypothetical protein|nr:hypothetical protein [Symbiobacteriaceae bacterium]